MREFFALGNPPPPILEFWPDFIKKKLATFIGLYRENNETMEWN